MINVDELNIPDLECRRIGDRAGANVARTIMRHSPDGFEFGYGGSGPLDLSYNYLIQFLPKDIVELIYREFCHKLIANIPRNGGTLSSNSVREWLEHNIGE